MVFIATFFIALLFGYYRQTLSQAESVHFSLNFPAKALSEVGGLGPRGHEGIVQVNLANIGLLKRLIQPNVVNLSSHWIKNTSHRPMRIKIYLINCDYPIHTSTPEKCWNEVTRTFERSINPGEMVSMDWNITIPDQFMTEKYILDAGVTVVDADTGNQISYLPVKIINTKDGKVPQGVECCAP